LFFLAGAVVSLAACGGGTTTATGTTTGTAPANKIVGSWARCNVTGTTSNKVVTTFGALSAGPRAGGFSGQASLQITNFTDADCSAIFFLESAVTVDGTVAGITAATQYSGYPSPAVDFDIIAANATQLFFGDKSTNTGATLALQLTQIETAAYTKQVALTSAALIGTWSVCGPNTPKAGDSTKFSTTYTATTFDYIQTVFGGTTDCNNAATTSQGPSVTGINYLLGNQVTVNGTVSGITNATQFIDGDFSLIAIKGTQLFIGDTNGAQDGTTEALGATQLIDLAFVKE
jgi:hypothetical protein